MGVTKREGQKNQRKGEEPPVSWLVSVDTSVNVKTGTEEIEVLFCSVLIGEVFRLL